MVYQYGGSRSTKRGTSVVNVELFQTHNNLETTLSHDSPKVSVLRLAHFPAVCRDISHLCQEPLGRFGTWTMSSAKDSIVEHGWTAVPVDPEATFKGKPYLHQPSPVLVKDITFPSDDPIVAKVQDYAKGKLAWQAYNHSMRVFYLCKSPALSDRFFNASKAPRR